MTTMPTTKTPSPTTVREVDVDTARRWIDEGTALLIDVRETDEHARERIPGATNHALSGLDPSLLAGHDGPILIHCRSGARSADACARLAAAGIEVVNVQGGIEAWKRAGHPTAASGQRLPISVMRQVQITIGVLVLAGVGLAATVSPWFMILPAFLGAGLVFAGVSGTCGLAAVLARMPWNRAFRTCGSGACG